MRLFSILSCSLSSFEDHLISDGHAMQAHKPLFYSPSTHLTEEPFFYAAKGKTCSRGTGLFGKERPPSRFQNVLLIKIVGKFVLLQAHKLGISIHDYKVHTLPGRLLSAPCPVPCRCRSLSGTARLRLIPPNRG